MNVNVHDKLIDGFEKRLVMYTDCLKKNAENEAYSDEQLKLLFDYVKEEWRIFDKLITEMLSYEVLESEEYGKIHKDGYKKYKEYFHICTETILNR